VPTGVIPDRMRVSGPVALVVAAALALWHWPDGPQLALAFTPLYPWARPAARPPGVPIVAFRELVRQQPEGVRLEYRNSSFEVHRFAARACRRDRGTAWHRQT
jgi:hypothetical protein